jgi:hypothetical protein
MEVGSRPATHNPHLEPRISHNPHLALCSLPFAPYPMLFALCPMRHALCSMRHALCDLDQSLNEKFDQFIFLVGLHDFISAGFGPGRKIGQ